MPSPRATFIPDILEEHLEELAFLWSQRQTALRDPRYTIHELTHLDGNLMFLNRDQSEGMPCSGDVSGRISLLTLDSSSLR